MYKAIWTWFDWIGHRFVLCVWKKQIWKTITKGKKLRSFSCPTTLYVKVTMIFFSSCFWFRFSISWELETYRVLHRHETYGEWFFITAEDWGKKKHCTHMYPPKHRKQRGLFFCSFNIWIMCQCFHFLDVRCSRWLLVDCDTCKYHATLFLFSCSQSRSRLCHQFRDSHCDPFSFFFFYFSRVFFFNRMTNLECFWEAKKRIIDF